MAKRIDKSKNVVRAISRTFDILEIVSCQTPSIKLTEISRKANLPKSAAHRILSTLIFLGYIKQDQNTKKYNLGPKTSHLANLLERKPNFSLQVRLFLLALVKSCKESVNLGILDQDKVLYLDSIEGPQPVRMASQKGVRGSLHSTALGKILLAYLPDENIDEIIKKKGLPQYTKNTITDPKSLKRQLKLIRKNRYAIDNEEDGLGAACIAGPVRNYTGQVIASVSIVGPSTRIFSCIDKLKNLIIETTDLISKNLGYETR